MTHRDMTIGLIGLLVGVTLGVATSLTGSNDALEGRIFRHAGTSRPDTAQFQLLRTQVRGALRK